MKRFAALYTALDATTATRDKLDALVDYFRAADPADAAWAAYFLAGGKPRQTVPTALLRSTAMNEAGLTEWLFDECYQAVGDLAETIAHILPPGSGTDTLGLAAWIEQRLLPLRGMPAEELTARLVQYWSELDWSGRFLLTKLIGGGFRVGVARQLVARALAEVAQVDHRRIAQRMVGWTDTRTMPSAERFLKLIERVPATGDNASSPALLDEGRHETYDDAADPGLPYPFFLSHPLQAAVGTLGEIGDWQAEWKWDGIRCQLVKRQGQVWLWSRGEDLITERFPELSALASVIPDGTVLDGEILAWEPGAALPLSFARLQPRIARKTLNRKILADSPVRLLVYDLLEHEGHDCRALPQHERRALLERCVLQYRHAQSGTAPLVLDLSPLIEAPDWTTLSVLREESRGRGVEGLMLKARNAQYGVGRTKSVGVWWKWKVDPYAVDAVLVYAQRGHGRRASLYTDYTFAVWDRAADGGRVLVPFAKAYSGLTDEEIRAVDAIIRRSTVETFGPVRSVTPSQVFEIGFEGIQASPRHKSGVAVRFPRMLRWRTDKPVDEADTLDTLQGMLDEHHRSR
jgi:DNA ligase 1